MDSALALNRQTISVVVATFDRPETLCVAVASALAQTIAPLEVIVIGDACDERTGAALARIHGPVRYINLSERHGEQAIPNSAGSAVARGDFVAYLNHDDVWLPHHLETALEEMEGAGRRWHVGAAAFSEPPPADAVDGPLAFTDRTLIERTIATAFHRANRYLEPVSSWVVDVRALEHIGWWRPARDLYRTPTQDLALRMWRGFGEPALSDEITVLKPGKQRRPRKGSPRPPAYRVRPIGYSWLAGLVDEIEIDGGVALRSAAAPVDGWSRPRDASIWEDPLGASPGAIRWARRLVGRRAAGLYRHTGIDLLDLVYRLFGTPRGVRLSRLLRNRTGESALPVASKESAIDEARAAARS